MADAGGITKSVCPEMSHMDVWKGTSLQLVGNWCPRALRDRMRSCGLLVYLIPEGSSRQERQLLMRELRHTENQTKGTRAPPWSSVVLLGLTTTYRDAQVRVRLLKMKIYYSSLEINTKS